MVTKGSNCYPFTKLIFIALILALFLATAFIPTRVQAFSVTITVDTAADNVTVDGHCSLREAITNANNNTATSDCSTGLGSAVIVFAGGLGTANIVLTSDLPAISDAAGLTINGGGKITVSGNDLYRVFLVNAGVPLTLDNLTVAHGLGNNGGGTYLATGGQLTILNSTFTNNHALVSGGGVLNHGGTLVITSSTFSGNSADSSSGGGLYSDGGTTSITNSTFSGNTASSDGGAIYNFAALTIANSTFLTNSAGFGGAISNSHVGSAIGSASILNSTFSNNSAVFGGFGVIYNIGVLSMSNTIIANSGLGSGDCAGTITIASSSNNLIEDKVNSNACGLTNGINGNLIGVNPNLGSATGSPAYLPLNAGSAAINAGDDVKCAAAPVNNTSQNGVARPNGLHCDIGAYEADLTPLRTYLPLIRR